MPDLHRFADAVARIRALLAEHPEGGDLARFLPPRPIRTGAGAAEPDCAL